MSRTPKLLSTIQEHFDLSQIQAICFNFPTWKWKTMPFWAHKHRQCAENGIVFPFQVGNLKFYACKNNFAESTTPKSAKLQISTKILSFSCLSKILRMYIYVYSMQVRDDSDFCSVIKMKIEVLYLHVLIYFDNMYWISHQNVYDFAMNLDRSSGLDLGCHENACTSLWH